MPYTYRPILVLISLLVSTNLDRPVRAEVAASSQPHQRRTVISTQEARDSQMTDFTIRVANLPGEEVSVVAELRTAGSEARVLAVSIAPERDQADGWRAFYMSAAPELAGLTTLRVTVTWFAPGLTGNSFSYRIPLQPADDAAGAATGSP